MEWTTQKITETIKTITSETIQDYGLTGGTDLDKGYRFGTDLGMDELDLNELICRIEIAFNINLPDNSVTLRSDVVDLIMLVRRLLLDNWSDFPEEILK